VFNLTRPPRTNRDLRRRLERGADAEDEDSVLRISLRGALVWSAGLAFAAYLAGAAFIVAQLDARSPHNRIGYLDLVLPTRWSNLDRLRGEAMLAEAKEALESGNYRDGLALLRAGLARAPDDHESRLLLVSAYSSGNLRAVGLEILGEGLDYGYPGKRYAELLLRLLTLSGLYGEAADTALRLHALQLKDETTNPRDAVEKTWLEEETARALIRAQRGEEAIAFVKTLSSAPTPFQREIIIAVHIKEGDHEAARKEAEAWLLEHPHSLQAMRLLVVACRELGDHQAMDRHLAELRRLLPPGPEAFLVAITNQHLAGQTRARDESVDDLLFRHGASSQTYAKAAPVFAEIAFEEGLDRLESEAARQGITARSIDWARLTIAQNRADWERVVRLVNTIETSPGAPLGEMEQAWLLTLRRLAAACLDSSSGTDVALVATVAKRSFPLKVYERIITALIEVGKIDAAATVLTLAEGPYPRSPDIQKLRAKIETMAELKLETANETRSASKRVEVGSFADFSSEFSQRLKDHGPARALDLIDVARRANPDWFDAESLNVDRMELPLRARGDDPLRLQIIARSVLARAPDEAPRVLKLAEEIRAQNPDHARLLVLEMIRQKTRPDDALARLRQWYPDEFSAEEAKLDTTQAARSSAK
jgi:hypothetical protein